MKKKSVVIAAALALLFSGAGVVFAGTPPVAALQRGVARLLRPLMRAADGAGRAIGGGGRMFSFSTCGACDDERTRREVAETKLVQAADENASLKKMLGLKQQFGSRVIPAAVAVYNQEWDREWLIIDAGEENGVRVGDPVIDEQQFLVGEVAEVWPGSAKVSVASNKGAAFGVVLAAPGGPSQQDSPAGGEALAHGLGSRALSVELIPRGTPVRPGDMAVRISKSDKKIPQIFAGRIAAVDERAGGAFKTAVAVLLSHPERIDRVMVITLP